MFEINRDLCINPACINESIVAHREITLILRIYQGGIASLINTCEGIIIPYLIIRDTTLSVYLTLRHRLVYGNSVYFCNAYQIVGDVDIHSFLSHHKLLAKFKYAVLSSQPFKWREIGEEQGVLCRIFK